ncbi:MAG: NYN domain-containing protein [Thiohalocapsa sp.]
MSSYAVLIDAGFLKRKLGSRDNPVDSARLMAFIDRLCSHERLVALRLHRIYYYDAPPLAGTIRKPLNGGRVDFSKTDLSRNNRAMLTQLAGQSFVSLRLGELQHRGWQVPGRSLPEKSENVTLTHEDLAPNIQQKGADMRIGLDIASLTLKRHVDVIVLVTGDSDFVPAMKFARREGAQLFLVTLGHSVRDQMIEHADLLLEVERP